MRKNYLMKSISIIFMLLAMMFSCQPVSEDIDSGNSNSNNTNQGGNTGGDDTGNGNGGGNTGGDNDNENEGGNTGGGNNPAKLTLQNLIDNANAGDEIDLSAHKDLSGYNATVNKPLTIKNGSLKNATLTVTAENVKLDKLENVSVTTSSKLSVNNSKLNVLSVGATTETSRSTISAVEMSPAMVSVAGCEIENVELNGFNSQLNIVDAKTKINDIVTSTKAKIILEAGSYEGMKDPTVTDDGELTRIDMTKEKELSVLSIYSNPKKAEYQIGEVLDVTGLVVMGTYTASIEVFKSGGWKGEAVDSVTKWEDEKDYTVTCEDFSTAGVKIVTITSNIDTKVKCNFYVYVKDPQTGEVPEAKISDIKLENAGTVKTSYLQGEKLDLSGVLITGMCNGYKINLPYTSEPANGTALTNVGEITVTFYYNGVQVNVLPITVEETFTIEFYDGIDNSKPLYTQKLAYQDIIKIPSSPVREDYTFTGWYFDKACTSPMNYYWARENIKLYAGWIKNVYINNVTIKVTNLPTEVKALSIWGTLNNYKLANIIADKDLYIADVTNGTATFNFDKFNIIVPLWCQFMPMTSKDMAMSDATWWQTAFSGSGSYSNAENNLVYDFSNKLAADNMILTLDVASVYGDMLSEKKMFEYRFCTEKYDEAFIVTAEGVYKIIYNGIDGAINSNVASFEVKKDVELKDASRLGYNFLGWYENADFSGNKITGWKAGEKKADVTLYAKWEECTYKIIYNGITEDTVNSNVTSFEITHDIRLKNPSRPGYNFLGWYEDADFSGNKITGWAAGDKTADVTLYAKWGENTPIIGGTNIYSYKLNIDEITGAWGGTTVSPAFSVVLLTDEQLADCKAAEDFYQATAAEPEYQISGYANMKIADTSRAGDYAVYGSYVPDNEYKYYDGVAVTVTENTFELFVDMSKITKTQLRANWGGNNQRLMTEDDIVDLTGYKPYVIALGQEQFDSDNYVFTAWNADVMKMSLTTSFPTDLQYAAPKVLTYYDLKYIAGNATIDETTGAWNHVALDSNLSYDFTYTYYGEDNFGEDVYDEFKFTNGDWDFQAGGIQISALDTEFELYSDNAIDNITFVDGLLTPGNEYTISLIVLGDNVAYVKVTAKE